MLGDAGFSGDWGSECAPFVAPGLSSGFGLALFAAPGQCPAEGRLRFIAGASCHTWGVPGGAGSGLPAHARGRLLLVLVGFFVNACVALMRAGHREWGLRPDARTTVLCAAGLEAWRTARVPEPSPVRPEPSPVRPEPSPVRPEPVEGLSKASTGSARTVGWSSPNGRVVEPER
jgi:hypothetical protein